MKALITGGRGFIGSFLVKKLLHKGIQVRCLLRNKGRDQGWLNGLDFEHSNGDITDPKSLPQAVKGVHYIFHLAGLTKSNSKSDFFKINANGTKNLLEATWNNNPNLKRFVLVSSLAAVGPSPHGKLLTELDAPRPITNYGKSKLKAEEITLKFANKLPISIVRPPAVYGPRDRDIFGLFKYAKYGWIPVLSGGPRFSSVIYVKDLVEGILLVVEKEKALGKVYFLSDDKPYSWDYFGGAVAQVLNVRPRRFVIPLPLAFLVSCGFELIANLTKQPTLFSLDKYRELKATHWICDNSKAKKELGFRPRFGLQKGLHETAQWYLENGWIE
ncbi:MAG: NAD-dependent epimerase/dehydratase family protein [bacterium]